MIDHVIANSRTQNSPAYQEYKSRVVAGGGIMHVPQHIMKLNYPLLKYNPHWAFIASGSRQGRLYTFRQNNSASDLNFSRNSKTTAWKDGKLIEIATGNPAYEWNPLTNDFEGISFSVQSTNLVSNSQSNIYGIALNVLIEQYQWPFTDLYNHAVKFPSGAVTAKCGKNVTLSNSGHTVFSFYVEMEDGAEPVPGAPGNAQTDFSIIIGSNAAETFEKRQVAQSIWRISGYAFINAVTSENYIQRTENNSGKGFKIVGLQIEADTRFMGRHVVTSGTIATKLADNTITNMAMPMNNICLYLDCYHYQNSQANAIQFSLRMFAATSGNAGLSIGFQDYGPVAFIINAPDQFRISPNIIEFGKRIKLAARVQNGHYVLAINGQLYYSGLYDFNNDPNYTNPYTTSARIAIGSPQRTSSIRAAAILPVLSDSQLQELTRL